MSILAGIPLVGDIIKTVFGSKQERDKQDADANAATHTQFAAEFGHTKNWFDSMVDGLNRLPRPVFAFGTIYLFVLCWIDPVAFAKGAVNLELMPQEAWWILGTIVVFFFGGRLHKDFGKYKIKKEVLAKYQNLSAGKPDIVKEIKPKDDVEWNERVEKRYGDYDNLN